MTADAEALPFEDESFDVVMSAIGVMFAPHHQDAADELVRVCRAGGTLGLLSWAPDGMLGALFRTMAPYAPPPPPGASAPPLWGGEGHLRTLFGDRVEWQTMERDVLEVTAFEHAHDYGEFFKARYGPTIAVRANAVREGREAEFDAALDAFCDEWNLGRRKASPLASRWPTCSQPGRESKAGLSLFRFLRDDTPSLPRTDDTWWSTVLGEITRASAISAFVAPVRSWASTSDSRGVRPSAWLRLAAPRAARDPADAARAELAAQ